MPYDGREFENQAKGLRREVKWSFIATCWYYWSETKCSGLPDDDEFLRLVCDCPEIDWVRTKGLIFGPLFTLAKSKWHHKAVSEEYASMMASHIRRLEISRLGVEARKRRPSVKPTVKP